MTFEKLLSDFLTNKVESLRQRVESPIKIDFSTFPPTIFLPHGNVSVGKLRNIQ